MSWFWLAVLSAVFATLTALFAKLGVDRLNPEYATLLRTFVIVFVIAPVTFAIGKWQNPLHLNRWTLTAIILSGICAALSWLCYFRALKLGDAAAVSAVDKLSLAMVAIVSVMVLGEKLTMPQWIGVLLVIVGAVLIAVYKQQTP